MNTCSQMFTRFNLSYVTLIEDFHSVVIFSVSVHTMYCVRVRVCVLNGYV